MKKILLSLVLVAMYIIAFAQDDMSMIWEAKLGHKIDYTGTGTEERGYSYAAGDKEMTVFANKDGKTIWTKPYSEIAPKLRKIDELIPFWESNTVFLFERKMGKDQMACIDLEKGTLLWSTDKYQNLSEDNVIYIEEKDGFILSLKEQIVFIKARTGEEVWTTTKFKGVVGQYVYNTSDETMVMVNFVPEAIAHLFTGFKNIIAKVSLKNGEILWENTYIGRAERKVISRDFLYDLSVVDDKVFLRLNGMQVYDLKTGANLWSAAFDFTPDGVASRPSGTVYKFGVYGAVAEPIVVGQDIYVLDMSNKKNQYIKKYDMNTGKLLWTSTEVPAARAIPAMYIIGDKILLQIGGRVEVQYRRQYKSGDQLITETAIIYPEVKPFGIKAFNTNDGKMVWESERFKKGITNAIQLGENFIVSSGKALYSLDVATGKENYEVDVKIGGVGEASMILSNNDDEIVVIGEKGMSKFAAKDGAVKCSGKYKASRLEERIGNLLIMKTDKADIATFKLEDCSYKEFKAKTGAATDMSLDGQFVYVYENKVVTKLSTK